LDGVGFQSPKGKKIVYDWSVKTFHPKFTAIDWPAIWIASHLIFIIVPKYTIPPFPLMGEGWQILIPLCGKE
jgi:hypothetical protein